MKLWDDEASLDPEVERYTVGRDYLVDRELIEYDCLASMAHAKMLRKMGVLSSEEERALKEALEEARELARSGRFEIRPEQEDCHTALEQFLVTKVGEAGKKIHTARSRNDQVLAALRLLYKARLREIDQLAVGFAEALKVFSRRWRAVPIPGYTHTRKAMPSTVGLWAGAFLESLQDNRKALRWAQGLIDQSPLGTGAGYGLPVKIDRALTARELGFARVQRNPLYVQNSRGKFEASIVHVLSLFHYDLNRFASDVIFFSMPELGYFQLPREICTGSSLMPHKHNPDVFEIMRAHYHSILSDEVAIASLSANLISGYHRDLQLIKVRVLDALRVTADSLSIAARVLPRIEVDAQRCREAMTPELFSAQRVLLEAFKGTAFRDAYRDEAQLWRKRGGQSQRP
ncbi:MAG: lyase family protein [candidate division KSB1 bacterium]|nr:lyase family protein [candidate division KSB1 bacterium]MDZ7384887.1 lyase family protein [candidate division KSB1 bacterium]MDZ7391438.1 lyase family protein [candidate division KSB1 bacterium]